MRTAGMTLIEVMVALVIATIGLVATLALLGTLMGGSSFSRQATEASVLVQSKIEDINGRTDVTPTNPADGTNQVEPPMDVFGVASASGPYTRTTLWSTEPTFNRRHANVTVQWTDLRGALHQVMGSVERIP